jgi:hypothetical protein
MVFFYSRCFGILGTFFVIHIPISNTCCYIPYTHDDYTVLVFNPSSYGPFFLCHLMASGHIEPGSWGHMRPGHETAYPSSPPHRSCHRALDTVSIDMISFNILFVACQVGNYSSYTNIFTFLINYNKYLSFGLMVAMSKGLSLSPST